MLAKVRPKLTYANVIATVCLFVVLGGSSIAAPVGKLITGKQIKKDSLTTKHVKNRSLLSGDFKLGQTAGGSAGAEGR